MKEDTEKKFKENGVDVVEHIIVDLVDNHVGKSLNEYLSYNDDIGFDFCVLGNCGVRAKSVTGFFVGRIANYIIKHSVINTVLVP